MEFRGFHCHFHGVFGLHFHGLPNNSVPPMFSIGVHETMDAMAGHGRGGNLQNSTEAMELDPVEN